MFRSEKTPQSVRWAVADALALLDITQVSQSLTEPLLAELADPLQRKQLKEVAKLRKTLAYLLGLLHHRNYQVRKFLAQDCLGQEGSKGSRDWSTWATAIVALGRIASKEDRALIAGIAAGRVNGAPDASRSRSCSRSPDSELTCAKRRSTRWPFWAISAKLTEDDVKQIAADPDLARTYYRAKHDVYWRQGGTARFE